MGQLRRQTILSSISTYFGFSVGALNTYLFVHAGRHTFSDAEYGLTRLFTDMGGMIYAFGSLGVSSVVYKFYPYYKDHLARRQNDLLTWALLVSLAGFVLVCLGGWFFEPLIIRKFSERSALFVVYYRWVFPFGFGFMLFYILETFAWTTRQSVWSTFLREGGIRIFVLLEIVPYLLGWIDFDVFIKIYAFQFLVMALILWGHLARKGLTNLTLRVSKVTRRFRKKMMSMAGLTYSGVIVTIVAQSFDGILITGFMGLPYVGIYALLLYIANIIQVPQRSVQAASIPHLSQAWKDKDYGRINRIYHRTSVNLLILSSALLCLIQLCAPTAGALFNIKPDYQAALLLPALFLLGLARVVDGGTGVNSQIIGTSVFWRFDFFTGIILLALRIPLNVWLIQAYGITGSAVADLISLVVYNLVRFIFLAVRFGMQPFNFKSLLAIGYAVGAYYASTLVCASLTGWALLFGRAACFLFLFGAAVLVSDLTPDTRQLWDGVRKKLGGRVD